MNKGTVIIIALITIAILMSVSVYFLNIVVVEIEISRSMENAARAHYIAESGINEAIWKLYNDVSWNENFISTDLNPDVNGNYWTDSFTRESIGGGSYTVTIENSAPGRGEIISSSEIPFFGKTARRVVRITVFRALEAPTENSGLFSGGSGENISITHSHLIISNGNIFSNHNLDISGESILEVYDDPDTEELEGRVLATQNIQLKGSSEITNYTMICAKNWCSEECDFCPPDDASVPMVDFDSESQYSFKSRALSNENSLNCEVVCETESGSPYQCADKCVFSSKEFEDLLWETGKGGILTLNNEITYIEGPFELRGGRSLAVNGSLVADGNIIIGERFSWTRQGQKDEGISHIEISSIAPDRPSGLLSKRKIEFGEYSLSRGIEMFGVIYAADQIKMTSIPERFKITGGIIARKFNITSLWRGLEIDVDNEEIMYGLGYKINDQLISPSFSPVIQIDHWEEVY